MTSIRQAYDKCQLARYGITFDAAIQDKMLTKCLQRVANALDKIKQPPHPKRPCSKHWQELDD